MNKNKTFTKNIRIRLKFNYIPRLPGEVRFKNQPMF